MKRALIQSAPILALALAGAVAEPFVSEGHGGAHHPPGYYLAFGALGCLFLIAVAKGASRWLLERREDYYDA